MKENILDDKVEIEEPEIEETEKNDTIKNYCPHAFP